MFSFGNYGNLVSNFIPVFTMWSQKASSFMVDISSDLLSVVDQVIKSWLYGILSIIAHQFFHGLRFLDENSITFARNVKTNNWSMLFKPLNQDLKIIIILYSVYFKLIDLCTWSILFFLFKKVQSAYIEGILGISV